MASEEDFFALQREPLSAKYAQAQAVKLVYDIPSEKLYYISNSYDYHNKFCNEELDYDEPLFIFNRDNYGNHQENRRFLLANINYFPSSKVYVMELSPSDKMPLESIEFLHQKIVSSSFLTDSMPLILNSMRLNLLHDSEQFKIATITPEDIYVDQEFQAVSRHEGVGKLLKVSISELDSVQLTSQDVVILDGTPLELSAVAGVITTELQTPLSHLSILGQNRKVPVMALKSAWQDSELESMLGKFVKLSVNDDGYSIELADEPELKKTTKKRKRLKKNLDIQGLVLAEDFDRKTSSYCGYKAENFGILLELSADHDFSVPESAFGIPFYFYEEHLKASGADSLISMLETSADPKVLLAEIRARILDTPVDAGLLYQVKEKITSLGTYKRLRFRSSTNAEDMKGFSGAGLYSSKTGELGNDEHPIDQAIVKVWASLWNYAAFAEREFYHFKQGDSSMGILVHRSFPNEAVNGVAITKNIYRDKNLGFVINAQLGDVSVVQPDPGIICDQLVCYPTENTGFYSQNETIEIITTSSLNNQKLVMTQEEIIHLANQLNAIKKFFYYRDFTQKTYSEYGLDLEFKLDENTRKLYIKQVRPYNY